MAPIILQEIYGKAIHMIYNFRTMNSKVKINFEQEFLFYLKNYQPAIYSLYCP